MEAKFYVRELDSFDINGKKKDGETKKVLFFRLVKASMGDPNAAPFEFDDRATLKHKQTYAAAFGKFIEELKESGEGDWDKIEGLDVKEDDVQVPDAKPENVENAGVDGGFSNESPAPDENEDNPPPGPAKDLPEPEKKEERP